MPEFAIRLVIAATILLALGKTFATQLVTPLLPIFAQVIEAADGRFRVERLSVAERRGGAFIESRVTLTGVLLIGNAKVLYPDHQLVFSPSTLVGNVLQPLILLFAILLAWRAPSGRALLLRVLFAAAAAAILLAVNYPLGLVGAMLDFRQKHPELPAAPMVYWNDFLQTGGPLALAAAASALVVSAADAIARTTVLVAPGIKADTASL